MGFSLSLINRAVISSENGQLSPFLHTDICHYRIILAYVCNLYLLNLEYLVCSWRVVQKPVLLGKSRYFLKVHMVSFRDKAVISSTLL